MERWWAPCCTALGIKSAPESGWLRRWPLQLRQGRAVSPRASQSGPRGQPNDVYRRAEAAGPMWWAKLVVASRLVSFRRQGC
jgi:hypothetical protein